MPIAQTALPLIESNRDLDHPAKLRAAMEANGYVYIRGLGPRDKILALRRFILTCCQEAGWLDSKADLMAARWSGAGPFAENDPQYMAVYKKIVNEPLFNALPADPFYMNLMAAILDAPVLLHRMHIGRISFPGNVLQTTPAHQDFHYIRGATDTYTIWTPLGDTPVEVGGLKVLRGSHRRGFFEHTLDPRQKYAGWGLGEQDLTNSTGDEWHTASYTAGDCVIFHSHTVHAAMPNLTADTLRLSIDNRYQRQGDVLGEAAQRTHHNL